MINQIEYINKGKTILKCKDYTVSKEEYNLYYNEEYDMLITNPIPKNIADYYKSDNYISHTNSNKSIIDKLYKLVRSYTLKRKLKLINSFKTEQKNLLDIGAGTGDFLNICKKNNWNINGVEPSSDARKIALEKNIKLVSDIKEFKNDKYDVITMWHVLEHIIELDDYINSLEKMLKSNGILIIAVPNYKSYDANYYKNYWAAYDVPRHIWHFSKKSIQILFEKVNMKLESTMPMKFDSYYVSLLSEKYKNNKTRPISAFYRGFISNLRASKTNEYSSLIYILKKNKK